MTIQVESILQEDIGYRESFSIRDEPAPEMDPQDPQVIAPLNGTITITHDPEGLAVNGKLETTVRLDCDRCMEPFEYQLTTPLEELFPAEPSINLDTMIRESIVLAVPAHKLCKNNCTVQLEY